MREEYKTCTNCDVYGTNACEDCFQWSMFKFKKVIRDKLRKDRKMEDYKELANELKEYSKERKGEISDLTYKAAIAIDVLIGRVKILERENELYK